MKILICGSDNFNNKEFIFSNLTDIISKEQCSKENPIGSWNMEIVYGNNPKPFDYIVQKWAKENKVSLKPFVAEWTNEKPKIPENWGKGSVCLWKPDYYNGYNALAGFVRNQEMVNYCVGALCIAFDAEEKKGNTATRDVVKRAKKQWMKVYHIKCSDTNKVETKIYNEGLQKE